MKLGLQKIVLEITRLLNPKRQIHLTFSHQILIKSPIALQTTSSICIGKNPGNYCSRVVKFHTSSPFHAKEESDEEKKALIIRATYFESMQEKNKKTFLEAIHIFLARGGDRRRGYVEFIYAALNNMEEFGVHRDVETYKKLMNIFPKGRLIPQGTWEVEFMWYPKQQQCAVDILDEMELNGVLPDTEMKDIIMATFGSRAFPMRKFMRMMYWMPKFKNLSPWPIPDPLPEIPIELAKIAMKRISSVDLETELTVFEAKDLDDSIDHTWIVSTQSPTQKDLIADCPVDSPVYVEGVFLVCLKYHMINYFILRADAKPTVKYVTKEELDDVSDIPVFVASEEHPEAKLSVIPSVHEQEDGTILAMCATGTSSRDSVLSWIRFLQIENPRLSQIPVLFKLRAPPTDLALREEENEEKKQWKAPVNQGPDLIT